MPIPAVVWLAGLGLLWAATSDKPAKKTPPPMPEGEGLYERVGSVIQVTPTARKQLLDSMLFRVLGPVETAPDGVGGAAVAIVGDGRIFGPQDGGAYYQLRQLWEQGFVIWIYPLQPNGTTGPEHPIIYLLPGDAPPEGLVRLIAPSDAWPAPPPGLTL